MSDIWLTFHGTKYVEETPVEVFGGPGLLRNLQRQRKHEDGTFTDHIRLADGTLARSAVSHIYRPSVNEIQKTRSATQVRRTTKKDSNKILRVYSGIEFVRPDPRSPAEEVR